MNFNSPEFLVFFPIVFALHWILPHRFRWALLLAASWFFYFWWEPWAGLLLVGTTLMSWLCAKGIFRTEKNAARRALFILALAVSLGCLGTFKYSSFFASTAGLELAWQIILPVGISFYTFQTLSYVIDVYRGTAEAEAHFGYYALFVSFFPQLVAGPIERPENLLPQLRTERRFSTQNLSAGAWLLLEGYFKKIVIADSLAPFVDRVYGAPDEALGPEIALATVLFGIQIYCDFSGYSSIARGAAKLLGVDLMENFKRPYGSKTVREFWRKWHISLTSWFTDYIYIPLGGSRKGLPRQVLNILIVFLLSGLWHGAGWNFVLWGLIHGLYQVGDILLERRKGTAARDGGPALPARVRTFLLVSFPWLFFRTASLGDAAVLLTRLFTGWVSTPVTLKQLLPMALPLVCRWQSGWQADKGSVTGRPPRWRCFVRLPPSALHGWLSCPLAARMPSSIFSFNAYEEKDHDHLYYACSAPVHAGGTAGMGVRSACSI